MGAWESGPFENDSALDWLDEAGGDPAAVGDAFGATAGGDYLDADVGSAGIAAAAVVAAAVDGNRAELPPEAQELAEALEVDEPLRASAIAALDAIVGEQSELRQLWSEGEAGAAWLESVARLRSRIGGGG